MDELTHTGQPSAPIGTLHEVAGVFASADRMHAAIEELLTSGFDRADLSVPDSAGAGPDTGARPADTEEDARQARTLHTSGVGAAAALAAAGITIATGGAAAPAAAAAVIAGAAAGGATYAASSAANAAEQQDRDVAAAQGALVLTVRAANDGKRAIAERVLQQAGATDVRAA